MTKNEAISFLKNNQPMPSDQDIEKNMSVLDKYDEVRRFFLSTPDKECIPLFLNSFGEGSGFGVYQLVEDVIIQFESNEVVPYLIKALMSKQKSVRYWNAQISSNFPDSRLIKPLKSLLLDDHDTKYMAIVALQQIGGNEVIEILKQVYILEKDETILEFIQDSLKDME